jgi:hypothetical protein
MVNEERQQAIDRVLAVKAKVKEDLLSRANVIGLGIGFKTVEGKQTEEIALVVLVSRKLPPTALAAQDRLPSEIEGVPIDVQEVGLIAPQG